MSHRKFFKKYSIITFLVVMLFLLPGIIPSNNQSTNGNTINPYLPDAGPYTGQNSDINHFNYKGRRHKFTEGAI